MLQLSRQQRQQLQEALIDAFPTKSSLEQMLSFGLNKNLAEIAGEGSLKDIIFKFIQTAEAEGWIEDLIRAARDSNSGNPKLQAIAQILAESTQELCNIPYPTNPLFTRRKTVLPQMRNVLLARKLASLIRLGDIGAMLVFSVFKPLELNQNNEWQFGKVLLKPMGNRTGAYQNLGESDQILINYRSDDLAQFVTLEKV